MGKSSRCQCLTCECVQNGARDYRDDSTLFEWQNYACPFCLIRIDTDDLWYAAGDVTAPYFIPDAVKEFLCMPFICRTCISHIDTQVRKLKGCWGQPEVTQLAILIVLRITLRKAITYRTPKNVAERLLWREEMAKMEERWAEEAANIPEPEIRIRVRPKLVQEGWGA